MDYINRIDFFPSDEFKNNIQDKLIKVNTVLSEPLLRQEEQMAKWKMISFFEGKISGVGVRMAPAPWDLLVSFLSSMVTHDDFRNLDP